MGWIRLNLNPKKASFVFFLVRGVCVGGVIRPLEQG